MALHVRKRRKLENNESQDIIALIDLPNEILTHILSYVITDLKKVAVRETCKGFRDVIDKHLLKDVCIHPAIHFLIFTTVESCNFFQNIYGLSCKNFYYHSAILFRKHAINGHLDVCVWLKETFQLKREDVLFDFYSLLYSVIQNGHLDICKWLNTITDINSFMDNDRKIDVFCVSAKHSYLELCRWLIEILQIPLSTLSNKVRELEIIGHLDTLRWLHEKHLLGEKSRNYSAFKKNVKYGHLDVCKWLVKENPKIDVRHSKDSIFFLSATHGHLNICTWLVDEYHITRKNLLCNIFILFEKCAIDGHLDVCIWLCESFHAAITINSSSWIFQESTKNGHLDVCKWIFKTNRPTLGHYYSAGSLKDIFTTNARKGNLEVCQWLHETFPMNLETYYNSFLCAMEDGQLHVCKWLYEISSPKYYTDCKPLSYFNFCIQNGYLDLSKWIQETWNITSEEMSSYSLEDNFLHNVTNRRLEMCKWIYHTFHISERFWHARYPIDEHSVHEILKRKGYLFNTLGELAQSNSLDLFKWIIETFYLIKNDIPRLGDYVLVQAACNGSLIICEYMHKTFDFTLDEVQLAIVDAAKSNCLYICKWFYETFHFSEVDTKALIVGINKSRSYLSKDIKAWIRTIKKV